MNLKITVAYVATFAFLFSLAMSSCNPKKETPTVKKEEVKKEEEKGGETSVAKQSFKDNVMPIFTKYCVSCHGAQGASAGVQLHNYATISQGAAASLAAIKRGSMPKGGPKLAASDITILENWIAEGKQNN